MKKYTRKKDNRVECYLFSKKINPNSNEKLPYVALLYCEPETGKFKRYFVNNKTNLWNKKHKKYIILFEFLAPIGFIVEFRDKPGIYSVKKYYVIRRKEKNYHLKNISRNRAYILSKKISRKLSKKNRHFRHVPEDVKFQVWHRDQGKCTYCGSTEEIEYDHIIPFSKGGSNTVENIQILCKYHNRLKSNKVIMGYGNQFALSNKKTYFGRKSAS